MSCSAEVCMMPGWFFSPNIASAASSATDIARARVRVFLRALTLRLEEIERCPSYELCALAVTPELLPGTLTHSGLASRLVDWLRAAAF